MTTKKYILFLDRYSAIDPASKTGDDFRRRALLVECQIRIRGVSGIRGQRAGIDEQRPADLFGERGMRVTEQNDIRAELFRTQGKRAERPFDAVTMPVRQKNFLFLDFQKELLISASVAVAADGIQFSGKLVQGQKIVDAVSAEKDKVGLFYRCGGVGGARG